MVQKYMKTCPTFLVKKKKKPGNQNNIEISPHFSENGYFQQHKQEQMLATMQVKRSPYCRQLAGT
jgi:hypothetical protein